MSESEKFKKFFGFGSEKNSDTVESHSEAEHVDNGQEREKAQAAVSEWTEKYVQLAADFQNYKKRVENERLEWSFEAQKKIIVGLLHIVDNFERALLQERTRDNGNESWLAGFEMIYQSIEKLLQTFGVQEITDFSLFNPKYHEALMQVESESHASGDIVQVLQKGYTMNDRVIRPATVSVAQ
jgi:molecular chaperone GrpE